MKNIVKITVVIALFLPSCGMSPDRKKHFAKKYSAMVVSDIALGYTCKTLLTLPVPVCAIADVAGDVALVTYYNSKYNKEQAEKAKITGEKFEHKTFEVKESLVDFGVFLAILFIIP